MLSNNVVHAAKSVLTGASPESNIQETDIVQYFSCYAPLRDSDIEWTWAEEWFQTEYPNLYAEYQKIISGESPDTSAGREISLKKGVKK